MAKQKLMLFEPDSRCLATTNRDIQCSNHVREADRLSATRLIDQLNSVTKDCGKDEDLKDILSLLLCGTHQKNDQTPLSQSLLMKYRPKFEEWAHHKKPQAPIDIRKSNASSTISTTAKLLKPISDKESVEGFVYVLTCADLPGMVKIGYASDVNSRSSVWGKCHSKPKTALAEKTIFPHRLEELVHCEMASKRYDVACPMHVCDVEYHNEWFKCNVDEAKNTIDQWAVLMNEHAMYNDKRQLDPVHQNIVRSLAKQGDNVTALMILDMLSVNNITNALKVSSLEDKIPADEDKNRLRVPAACYGGAEHE